MAIPLRITLTLALLTPMLAACTLFHPKTLARQSRDWVPKERNPAEFAQSQMALGRDALSLEQYGLAVACFRAAQQDPEHAPDAHNGLGVAYANLGRPDLAARYFQMAMSERPSDRRFAANLERLNANQAEQRLASAELPATAPIDVDNSTPPKAVSTRVVSQGITVELPEQHLRRVSGGAVVIDRPVPAQPVRRVAADMAPKSYNVRRRNPQYPVRFAMRAVPRPAAGEQTNGAALRYPSYPMRITIETRLVAQPVGNKLAR